MLNKALMLACLAGVAGPAAGQVIVTEVFYNPAGFEAETEWVEITNVGVTPVNITNYALDDEDNTTPSHRIGAGLIRLPNGTTLPASSDPECETVDLASGGGFACDTVNTLILQPGQSAILGGLWDGRQNGSNNGVNNTADDFVRSWGVDTDGDGLGDTVNYPIVLQIGQITIANTADPENEVLELVELMPDGTIVSRDFVNYQVGNSQNDWPFSSNGRSIYLQPNFNSSAASQELIGAAWTLASAGRDLVIEGRQVDTVNVNTGAAVSGLYAGGDAASPGAHPTVAQSFEDANGNGRDDAVDIFIGFSEDCNRNSIPDEAEADCNANGIPDACEFQINQEDDCDGNGSPDDCDIAANPSLDTDSNGVLDVCQNVAGFGDIIITEIMFDPSGTEREWVELYNAGSAPVDVAGWFFQDLDQPIFDGPETPIAPDTDTDADGILDALILAPGEVLVVANRTLADWQLGWGPINGQYRFAQSNINLANNSDLVNEVRTLLAPAGDGVTNVRIDVANYQSTNSNGVPQANWPGNDGRGSLYLLASGIGRPDNNDPENWALSIRSVDGARSPAAAGGFDGRDAGSPGVVNTGAPVRPLGQVIISEIHFATNSDFPGLPFPDETDGIDEWVEILNVSGGTIDISGWTLEDEDGNTTALPSGATLQDGEAAVIIANDFVLENPTPVTEFYDAWDCGYQIFTVEQWYSPSPTGLNRLGDTAEGGSATNPSTGREILQLRDAADNVQDVVNYDDDGFVWPLVSNGLPFIDAFSIYLFRTADLNELDNDDGLNWATSLAGFDGAIANTLTTVYNGRAFGSPGFVNGVTVNFNPNNCISTDPILPLCADQNGDGQVAPNDFSAWIANFNAGNLRADVNRDGQVAPNDFSAWIAAFNLGQNGPICP
jgi:hypothetical protein